MDGGVQDAAADAEAHADAESTSVCADAAFDHELLLESPSGCVSVEAVASNTLCLLPSWSDPREATVFRLRTGPLVGEQRVYWQALAPSPASCEGRPGRGCQVWFYKARAEFSGGACSCGQAGINSSVRECFDGPCIVSRGARDHDRLVSVQVWEPDVRWRLWLCSGDASP